MKNTPLFPSVAAFALAAVVAGSALAQSGGSTSGAAGGTGAGSGATTGPLGSGAPNPGLNANTTPGNRIGPGGAPLAAGASGSNVPTYGTGPGGVPQAIGPNRDTTGSSVGAGSLGGTGSPSTSSGRAGCATESQTATASGTIYQRDTTGLGPTPRIMNEEPGRPPSAASAATGRSGAGC
jgi:hypothetical protein